ncbi:MAG: NYN domain-containing protein [Caldilineaceae bacterium]
MHTHIYIDGYNLYYGCLHRTPYKWLDVHKLFANHVLKAQSPEATVTKVKYFTADIRANLATYGQAANHAQNSYHRALQYSYPDQLEIIKGYYALERAMLPRYKRPPDRADVLAVWRLEEKQTDVNIALHLYRDAMVQQNCDQVVVVSNDTDLAPAIKLLREDAGDRVQIGIVLPVSKYLPGTPHRPPNMQLSQYAHWTRRYILEEELQNSQLPSLIPTRKKPIHKPDYW